MKTRQRKAGQATVASALLLAAATLGGTAFVTLGKAEGAAIASNSHAASSADKVRDDDKANAQQEPTSSEFDPEPHNPSAITSTNHAAGSSGRLIDGSEGSSGIDLTQLPFEEPEHDASFGTWLKNAALQPIRIATQAENQYAAEVGAREVATGFLGMIGMIPIGLNNLIEKVPFFDPRPFHESKEARAMLDGLIMMGGFKENGIFNGFLTLGSGMMGPAMAHEFKSFGSKNSLNGSWAMGSWWMDILPWLSAFSPYAYTQGVAPLAEAARHASGLRGGAQVAAEAGDLLSTTGARNSGYVFQNGLWVPGTSKLDVNLGPIDEKGFVRHPNGLHIPADDGSTQLSSGLFVPGQTELNVARRPSGLFVPGKTEDGVASRPSGLLVTGQSNQGYVRLANGLDVPTSDGYARLESGLQVPESTQSVVETTQSAAAPQKSLMGRIAGWFSNKLSGD